MRGCAMTRTPRKSLKRLKLRSRCAAASANGVTNVSIINQLYTGLGPVTGAFALHLKSLFGRIQST
jgi:hypothetical protein